MMSRPKIWIIDTTVLLNILDVPGMAQNRSEVNKKFLERILNVDEFALPFTTILETGNHINRLSDSGDRKRIAERFRALILSEDKHWILLDYPTDIDIKNWITDFPNNCERSIGFGDHIIIKQFDRVVAKLPRYEIEIWSEDSHLQGYIGNAEVI